MTRLLPHTATGPLKVLKADHPGDALYVCRCGLTANPSGLCDGSHKVTRDEMPGSVYSYERVDGQLLRIAVAASVGVQTPLQAPAPSNPEVKA